MAKEEINITIAAKSYKLNVDSSKCELYRLAERHVNSAIMKFKKQNFAGYGAMDALALTAFELAISNIALKQQSEVESEEAATLKRLEQKIDDYLNDLSREAIR